MKRISYESVRRMVRSNDLTWRYVFNLAPTVQFLAERSAVPTQTERKLTSRLRSEGVAVTSVGELLPEKSTFEELVDETKRILREKDDEIKLLRSRANDASSIGSKTFNFEVLGSEPLFDPQCVFARFALERVLLNLANSYFRMCVKLRYYNVWNTFASDSASRESQLWHVDREDNRILKVFLYLNDVDEGTGPFTYAAGTQKGGRYRNVKPESFLEGGVRRTTDEQMDKVVPQAEWVRCTGKKGTLVLADTGGYHKGGEARTRDRLMFTCMYTSPASESKRLLNYPAAMQIDKFHDWQKRALQYPR